MGVDYNAKLIAGSKKKADFDKLPRKAWAELKEEHETSDKEFKGFQLWGDNYSDNEFIIFGIELTDCSHDDAEPSEIKLKDIITVLDKVSKLFIKYGLSDPKLYTFQYVW